MRYLESLPEEAHAEWRRAMQYLLLLIQNKREPQEHIGLRDVVIASAARKHQEEVRTMAITASQAFEAKGRQEGQQLLLLAQLAQKFGELPAGVVSKVQAMTEAQLTQVGVRLMTAATLEELEMEMQ